ncbi:hypothetical protein Afil01_10750 [Actinorhabdospora filicis]|uniref:TfoX N-terminal domain-containing protein n=1 Tax=Actinorhabdospora filicis TaxID=1785913 RepID=A0A9W6W7T8_9ACTN|nr:hypothetical protein [Actinorhabdospora filicis]GLZ76268.1 hypothetical protein Afil01_10750 [Actinorhabdospora filicis]
MTDPETYYADLADEYLAREDVAPGRSLQSRTLTVAGKIFAFLKSGRLVVKVPAARAAELVAGGAEPFSSGGRVTREWVAIEDPPAWAAAMAEAYEYATGSTRP